MFLHWPKALGQHMLGVGVGEVDGCSGLLISPEEELEWQKGRWETSLILRVPPGISSGYLQQHLPHGTGKEPELKEGGGLLGATQRVIQSSSHPG
jgi:hypothetical protein